MAKFKKSHSNSKLNHKDVERIEKLRLLVSYLKSGSSQPIVSPIALEPDEIELAERYSIQDAESSNQRRAINANSTPVIGMNYSNDQLDRLDRCAQCSSSICCGATISSSYSSGLSNIYAGSGGSRIGDHCGETAHILGSSFVQSPLPVANSQPYDQAKQSQSASIGQLPKLFYIDDPSEFPSPILPTPPPTGPIVASPSGSSADANGDLQHNRLASCGTLATTPTTLTSGTGSMNRCSSNSCLSSCCQSVSPAGNSAASRANLSYLSAPVASNDFKTNNFLLPTSATTASNLSAPTPAISHSSRSSSSISAWTNPQNLATWIDNEVNSLVQDLETESKLVKLNEKPAKSKRKWLSVGSGIRRNSSGAQST